MKIASYQAPLCSTNMAGEIGLIQKQIKKCETGGVDVLCCPESILGGLADNVERPADIAINSVNGDLERIVGPLSSNAVAVIVGFTEMTGDGMLYNSAAVLCRGDILGIYRKQHPAIRRSVYAAGELTMVFDVPGLRFGILICNDSNFTGHAAEIASLGAAVLFIPSNTALPAGRPDVAAKTRSVDIALAADFGLCVARADVAGSIGGMTSPGTSAIVAADGSILVEAAPFSEDLIIAEID